MLFDEKCVCVIKGQIVGEDNICKCPIDQISDGINCVCVIKGQIVGEDNTCKCPIDQISDGIKCVCVIKGQIVGEDNTCKCPIDQISDGINCVCVIKGQIIDSTNTCNCPANQKIDEYKCTCVFDGQTLGNPDLLLTDPKNCGKCGKSCSTDLICLDGSCQPCNGDFCSCPPGQSICGKECTSFCLPSQIIDLTNWKLTLPISADQLNPYGSPATEIKGQRLLSYSDQYFNVVEGFINFISIVGGGFTSLK
jgi:hypothetical protein